jgi:hypothetical protein
VVRSNRRCTEGTVIEKNWAGVTIKWDSRGEGGVRFIPAKGGKGVGVAGTKSVIFWFPQEHHFFFRVISAEDGTGTPAVPVKVMRCNARMALTTMSLD